MLLTRILSRVLINLCQLKYTTYKLKIEDYYFDEIQNTYILVIRHRFHSNTTVIAIDNILQDKLILSKLHPYDVYIIGMITVYNCYKINFGEASKYLTFSRDYDDYFVLEDSQHVVCWKGMDYTSSSLIFENNMSGLLTKIPIKSFYYNNILLNGLTTENIIQVATIVTTNLVLSDI